MPASDDRSIPTQLRWWAEQAERARELSRSAHLDPSVTPGAIDQRIAVLDDYASSVSQAIRELAERVEREAEEE